MKNGSHNLSLLKKLTIICMVFLIAPSILIASFFFRQQFRQLYDQVYRERSLSSSQICENLDTSLLSVEDLSFMLTYRSPIVNLIERADLNEYPIFVKRSTENLLGKIQYSLIYQNAGLQDISVYTDNPGLKTVPHFYSDERINSLPFYVDFINSGKNSSIYYLNSEDAENYFRKKGQPTDCPYGIVLQLHNIEKSSFAQYYGLLVFEIDPQTILSPITDDQSANSYSLYFSNLHDVYGAQLPQGMVEKLESFDASNSLVNLGNYNYMVQKVGDYPIFLVNTEPLDRASYILPSLKLSSAILVLAFIQFLIHYFIIRYIFRRIDHNINEMDKIIANGFRGTVSATNDEIGHVAQRYNILLVKINNLVKDIVRKETDSKNAQIKVLQYQMNPHFIYNTLSIFSGCAEQSGNHELSEAISYFGHLLRYNIKNTGLYSTVGQEVENAYALIQVYSMRYKGKLQLTTSIPEIFKSEKIIKYLLQPLLENAIFHGKRKNSENMNVSLSLRCDGENMIIEIEDDGIGMTSQRLEEVQRNILYGSNMTAVSASNSSCIGLHNVYKRLMLVYDNRADLTIDSKLDVGTKVTVKIPFIEYEE